MNTLFDLLFRYFPIVAFGIVLLNLWSVRARATRSGKVSLVLLAGIFLLWATLQVAGGYDTFFFVLLPPAEHPLAGVFWLLYFALLWSVTGWVVWGNGATELLSGGVIHLRNVKATPRTVKFMFVALSMGVPVLLVLGHAFGVWRDLLNELAQLYAN